MKIEQLKEIIRIERKFVMTTIRAMAQELYEQGYEQAEKSKYADFPIHTILKGSERETEWRMDCTGRFEFKGSIYTNVEGADGAEFIAISVNKIDKAKDMSIPYQVLWFVKEEKK